MDAKTAFISMRPWSFTMTFSSVTMGTLVAALAGRFNPLYYLVALGGMVAFHGATNILNDFFDVKHGVDRGGAPTTKYRLHPAALGQAPLSSILALSLTLYLVTLAAASYLALATNLWILVVVGIGMAGSVLYTADPVVLKARALGEATVFAMWGLLIPLGSYMVQTGTFSLAPVAASVPIGIFVALVLLANNIRDIGYDGSVKTRTLAVVLGAKRGERLYAVLLGLAYVAVASGVAVRLLPLWSVLVFLTVPGARGLVAMLKGDVPDNADPRTAALALQFSLIYMASLVLAIFFPFTLQA
ncbi:MAG: prenyltransferase [Nitrososphaerota archaeon]|nr:prenyltransferase [Nitrososphaerota archaeon]